MSQLLKTKRVTRKSFEAKNKERKGGSSLLHSTINTKKNPTPHIDLLGWLVIFISTCEQYTGTFRKENKRERKIYVYIYTIQNTYKKNPKKHSD